MPTGGSTRLREKILGTPLQLRILVFTRFSIGLHRAFNMLAISKPRTCLRRLYISLHAHYNARIERVPLVVSRKSSTAPSSSKLVVSGKLEGFPLSETNFRDLRSFPGLAYFDKTSYIAAIAEAPNVQLLCRPRRFGKSLTISMLESFHGVEFHDRYDVLFKVCGRDMFIYLYFILFYLFDMCFCMIYVHISLTLGLGS